VKVLVAIANYGKKNMGYLNTLINEYRSMTYHVDVIVLSNIPKDLGTDIEVIVGLPTKDPWSLPFGHKKIFAERADDYDLFIYSEDDTLISENNITAFLDVTTVLPDNEIAGFMRYEIDASGKKYISTAHSHYHWLPDTVESHGDYTFARFTNDHSACYLLTRDQLKKAIESGGYLVAPHQGRYDLLCSAATDPYTQCGFSKVICVSPFHDFLIHHMPNQYIGKLGVALNEFELQLRELIAMKMDNQKNGQLFQTEKNLPTAKWNKSYYEPCRNDLLELVPQHAESVLSVGCGWGVTEAELVAKGCRVVAIPLDSIIAAVAQARGVTAIPPSFDSGIQLLADDHFDCIIFSNILQHLSDPAGILSRYSKVLSKNGIIVLSVPNLNHIKIWRDYKLSKNFHLSNNFDVTQLHFTTEKMVETWFNKSGLERVLMKYNFEDRYEKISRKSLGMIDALLASEMVFVGRRSGG